MLPTLVLAGAAGVATGSGVLAAATWRTYRRARRLLGPQARSQRPPRVLEDEELTGLRVDEVARQFALGGLVAVAVVGAGAILVDGARVSLALLGIVAVAIGGVLAAATPLARAYVRSRAQTQRARLQASMLRPLAIIALLRLARPVSLEAAWVDYVRWRGRLSGSPGAQWLAAWTAKADTIGLGRALLEWGTAMRVPIVADIGATFERAQLEGIGVADPLLRMVELANQQATDQLYRRLRRRANRTLLALYPVVVAVIVGFAAQILVGAGVHGGL